MIHLRERQGFQGFVAERSKVVDVTLRVGANGASIGRRFCRYTRLLGGQRFIGAASQLLRRTCLG